MVAIVNSQNPTMSPWPERTILLYELTGTTVCGMTKFYSEETNIYLWKSSILFALLSFRASFAIGLFILYFLHCCIFHFDCFFSFFAAGFAIITLFSSYFLLQFNVDYIRPFIMISFGSCVLLQ